MNDDLRSAIAVVNTGLKVLTTRALSFCVMLATFSLFAWCLFDPNWMRIASASLFALFGLAMCRSDEKERKRNEDEMAH